MAKAFLLIGSLLAFLGVLLGAFGAHLLKDRLTESGYLDVYQTAVQYQFVHALALILLGIIALQWSGSTWLLWAGLFMAIGVLIFSGSLYGLSLSGIRVLGAITPIGGMCFLIGWALTAIAVWKQL